MAATPDRKSPAAPGPQPGGRGRRQTPRQLKLLLDGSWRSSTSGILDPVTDASTGQVIARVPRCTGAEIDAAVAAARAAFPGWAGRPAAARTQVVYAFRQLVLDRLDDLALTLSREMGKTLAEARGEVLKVVEACEVAVAAPLELQGRSLMQVSRGHDTVSCREPVGVFAAIVPYNFPAMIPFGWIAPICLAAGNTLVLKLNSFTPCTGVRLAELLLRAGLPAGVLNLVACGPEEAGRLATHPDVAGVTFVGSTAVGRQVYAAAAAAGKRVQCLCGAKNHTLVLADAQLEAAATAVAGSAFGCAGQRCMAFPVVVVQEPVADAFVQRLLRAVSRIRVGCAYDPASTMGPLVSAERRDAVRRWIDRGEEQGARLLADGRGTVVPGFESGFFVGPTLFDGVEESMDVGREEIFGPVLCIRRVRDFEEGLAAMNRSPYANGAAVFTASGRLAREFARRSHGGMIGVNVGIPVPVSFFPFAGHKASFLGDLHALGRDGFAFYTETTCVTSRWPADEDGDSGDTWQGTTARGQAGD